MSFKDETMVLTMLSGLNTLRQFSDTKAGCLEFLTPKYLQGKFQKEH